MVSSSDEADAPKQAKEAQWERAHQVWELAIVGEAADLREDSLRKVLFRILRVKRSEQPSFLEKLPGVVRRGARVDLQPLEEALRHAGLSCVLRRARRHRPLDRAR